MSDIILKFWPVLNVEINKTSIIKEGLFKEGVIDKEIDFWGTPAFTAGNDFSLYIESVIDPSNPYFKDLAITISAKGYGVFSGSEEFEYIDRNNVIEVKGGDGSLEKWDKMLVLLEKITEDSYHGGWEIQ